MLVIITNIVYRNYSDNSKWPKMFNSEYYPDNFSVEVLAHFKCAPITSVDERRSFS